MDSEIYMTIYPYTSIISVQGRIMKRNLLKLIPVLVLSFVLSSCGFDNIFNPSQIVSIDISDDHGNYVLGDKFVDASKLTINATRRDKNIQKLSLADMDSYELTYSSTGEKYTYDTAFDKTGTYNFTVTKGKITSNTLTINVLERHVYVNAMILTGELEVEAKTTTSLTLTVNPTNYTCGINYQADKENNVILTKTATGVDVYAAKPGTVTITASSLSGPNSTITAKHTLTITSDNVLTPMSQTYNDLVKNSLNNISACPNKGDVKLLVIPIWFIDSSNFITTSNKENVREDIRRAYFGTPEETGWQSVSSYYHEESGGSLRLSGTVSEWYQINDSYAKAGLNSYDTSGLVKNAVNWYFNNHTDDSRSSYDYDKDGYLDGVMLIYAAPDAQQSGYEDLPNLWAYCFWIQEKSSPANVYFWASYDFMYSKRIAQQRAGTGYAHGDTSHCNVDAHTFIHEMGHVFGLDDYYDYSKKTIPAGGFSMQDYNVGGHDPYSMLALGWAEAYIPEATSTIQIGDFQKTKELILLSPEFNVYNSPFDEYLLLELYTNNGLNNFDSRYRYSDQYPLGLSSVGIRLWHVDARLMTGMGTSYHLVDSANVKQGRVKVGMTNTSYDANDPDSQKYLTLLGSEYYEYNLLQFIRNNKFVTYKCNDNIKTTDLFYAGDSFSMSEYSRQFANGTKLNNGNDLEWSFRVNTILNENGIATASITVTRL